MNKTGKFHSVYMRAILFICLSLSAQAVFSQDYTLDATVSENRIFTGEQFRLSIEVSGSSMRDVSLPVLPSAIDGVRILSTTPSRSSSISIVNGRTSTSTTYTYSLIARETGNYTIPPVTIEIDGEERQTDPIQIEIIEKGNLSANGQPQLPEIFIEMEVNDDTPTAGQQIIASLVLYYKQGIEVTSFQPSAGWRTDGFWKEELENISAPQAESVILSGVRYRKATLLRYALFPTRSGDLTLNEFTMTLGVRSQASRNDPFGSFFGGAGTNQRRVSLESDPVTLSVNPQPTPENAVSINAVGNLQVDRTISTGRVESGETIELVTHVEGTGNIPLVRKPEYNLPEGLDLFTPEETSNIERRGQTIRGNKTFTELLVARAPGTYEIPSERVAIFNPQTRSFRYQSLPALEFTVVPGSGNQFAGTGSSVSVPLQPVSGLAVWHNGSNRPVYHSYWFWILLALPAIAIAVAVKQKSLRKKLSTDQTFARAHHAFDRAEERIESAYQLIDSEPKDVYSILHKALSGFITDSLGLQEAGLSDNELIEQVKKKGDEKLVQQLRYLLTKCATISYAPAGDREDVKSDINKTENLIKAMRKKF